MSDALCPTCKQPMPREATTLDPRASRGAPQLQCEFCGKPATLIVNRKAVCYVCRWLKA